MKNWVATNYPGTKIGVTEYNWGAESAMSGATAQADILGIFGREGLDLATRWGTPATGTPTYNAMKIYRNYDGKNSAFGDTSVAAGGPNPDDVAVFAAQRSSDNALTIMVVNKNLSGAAPLNIDVAHFSPGNSAQVWQLNSSNVIAKLPNVTVAANSIATTVPAQSITLFVLPATVALDFTPGPVRLDGKFQFSLSGSVGASFVLQTSTDLVHWLAMNTNTFTNSTEQFVLSGGQAMDFYRAVASN